MPALPKVYLFWDNSNIFISAKHVAEQKERFLQGAQIRIQFENLIKLAVAGRPVAKAIAIGSIPPEERGLWDTLQSRTGIKLELYERGGQSGTEQGLDQCLQVHMLRALTDEQQPQVAVLLTGDGKGYDDGVGFHADLERMAAEGWGIEVLAWDISCKRSLKNWAENAGVLVKLEDHYESITFLEGGIRKAKQVNLTHRKFSSPRIRQQAPDPTLSLQAELDRMRERVQALEAETILSKQDAAKAKRDASASKEALQRKEDHLRQMEAKIRNSKDPSHTRKRVQQAKKRKRKA